MGVPGVSSFIKIGGQKKNFYPFFTPTSTFEHFVDAHRPPNPPHTHNTFTHQKNAE